MEPEERNDYNMGEPGITEGDRRRAEIASENVIHSGGDVDEDDLEAGGFVGSTYGTGTGGNSDVTGGRETRGAPGGAFGTRTGGLEGGTGIEGMDVNSSDAGRSDITGGGTASGLGATNGGGTL